MYRHLVNDRKFGGIANLRNYAPEIRGHSIGQEKYRAVHTCVKDRHLT